MALVFLSLGSNLGNRESYLEQARKAIAKSFSDARFSGIYETEPVDLADQPLFLNQVAEFRTDLSPESLLEWAKALESQAGRQRTVSKGPGPWTLIFSCMMIGFWTWKIWSCPIRGWRSEGTYLSHWWSWHRIELFRTLGYRFLRRWRK